MKVVFRFLFFQAVVFVTANPTAQKKNSLIVHTKQRRWLADDLKQHYAHMRKVHEDYIPSYPDAPVLAPISIGTPPVTYWVSQETGSEALFVLGKDYLGRKDNQSFFDPAQSSTAQYAGSYTGFSGKLEAYGAAYYDVVGLLGQGISQNTTQRFGVVDTVIDPNWDIPEMPVGVVGMSWNPADAANPNENSSAILNFFKEFGYAERYYIDFLAASTDPKDGRQIDGITSFGEPLHGWCASATFANTYPLVWLEDSRSLAFQVDAFTYKGQQFAGGYAKVDTGVPNILLLFDAFLAIYYDVQPNYDMDYALYTVDCSKAGVLPDWTLTIGGNNYTIPSSSYVVDLQLPDGQCALSLLDSEGVTTDYVFGYVFHNHWCIKMDIDNQAISLMDVLPPPTDEPAVEKN